MSNPVLIKTGIYEANLEAFFDVSIRHVERLTFNVINKNSCRCCLRSELETCQDTHWDVYEAHISVLLLYAVLC